MKTRLSVGSALIAAVAALCAAGSVWAAPAQHTVYRVIDLGDPGGGTNAQGTSDTQPGWVVGFSALPGNAVMHAELWRGGAVGGERRPDGKPAE